MGEQRGPQARWRRGAGLALIAGAVLGWGLVLIGLLWVAYGLGSLQRSLETNLASVEESLALTADSLDLAILALGEANTTLSALGDTLGSATVALTDTVPTLGSVADLAGTSLPESLRSTQSALASARETARVIDRVLGAISSIGLLSSTTYNPEVPLNEAIAGVSDSLDELPGSLERVEGGLRDTADNLASINADLAGVTAGVEDLTVSVRRASASLAEYRQIVADLRLQLASVGERLPVWFIALRVGLLLGLIWMAITQLSLLAHGWELLSGRR